MNISKRVQRYNKNCTYASFWAFFCRAECHSAISGSLKTMRIAYMPLENGVPKRPFRPQAQAADTTVFTEHIPIRRRRRLSKIKSDVRSDMQKNALNAAYVSQDATVATEGPHLNGGGGRRTTVQSPTFVQTCFFK